MAVGFGRVIVDGTLLDDPYDDTVEQASSFEVLSDAGPRYAVRRVDPQSVDGVRERWAVERVDPAPEVEIGSVWRQHSFLTSPQIWFQESGGAFPDSSQSLLINAVFALMGEAERRSGVSDHG